MHKFLRNFEASASSSAAHQYLHRERVFSTFHRRIRFGESIESEKMSASMAEGVLEIKLPKLEPKPKEKRKKITQK